MFNRSAFKHGFTEENIRHALNRPEYEGPLEEDWTKHIVLGFDDSGCLLEILYNIKADGTVHVFHAMKCRSMFFHLLEELGEKMTEEEAEALDEYYTKNPPTIDPAKKGGFFTRQRELLDALDRVSADYIMSRSLSTNKTPSQIIGEMVRERIASATP